MFSFKKCPVPFPLDKPPGVVLFSIESKFLTLAGNMSKDSAGRREGTKRAQPWGTCGELEREKASPQEPTSIQQCSQNAVYNVNKRKDTG